MPDLPNLADLKRPVAVPAGPERDQAQAGAELIRGMRCGGCGRRIRIGVSILAFVAEFAGGKPQMKPRKRAACSRDDCDYAQTEAKSADVMEMIEFAWRGADPDESGAVTLRLLGR